MSMPPEGLPGPTANWLMELRRRRGVVSRDGQWLVVGENTVEVGPAILWAFGLVGPHAVEVLLALGLFAKEDPEQGCLVAELDSAQLAEKIAQAGGARRSASSIRRHLATLRRAQLIWYEQDSGPGGKFGTSRYLVFPEMSAGDLAGAGPTSDGTVARLGDTGSPDTVARLGDTGDLQAFSGVSIIGPAADRTDAEHRVSYGDDDLTIISEGEDPQGGSLVALLRQHGVQSKVAEGLVARFDAEVIARQIAWFSDRVAELEAKEGVQNPAGLLIASIRRDLPKPRPIPPKRDPAPLPAAEDPEDGEAHARAIEAFARLSEEERTPLIAQARSEIVAQNEGNEFGRRLIEDNPLLLERQALAAAAHRHLASFPDQAKEQEQDQASDSSKWQRVKDSLLAEDPTADVVLEQLDAVCGSGRVIVSGTPEATGVFERELLPKVRLLGLMVGLDVHVRRRAV